MYILKHVTVRGTLFNNGFCASFEPVRLLLRKVLLEVPEARENFS